MKTSQENHLDNGTVNERQSPLRHPLFPRLVLPIIGLLSTIWMLLRIIPKPTRASYPCMKVAAPLASTFIAYLVGGLVSLFSFKKARNALQQRRLQYVLLFTVLLVASTGFVVFNSSLPIFAKVESAARFNDPLGPNQPIGEAKGIYPGRVVWIHDPNATNENCTNSDHDDAYWLEKNTDQNVVDQMYRKGLLELTGAETLPAAWDAIFKYYNSNHGKGDVGYSSSETIFIKINAVTAWSGAAPTGEMPSNIGIEFDTSPQTILSMLRQLVNEAGVPQENIFVGDPMADIWNHLYNKFHAEFPNINYVSKRNIPGRTRLTAGGIGVKYSDRGTVMNDLSGSSHRLFTAMLDADYLLNIPSMKGHRWAGVTFFAKNHFGSNTTSGSWQLHKGLMNPDNTPPLRTDYHMYRVLVDLMGSKNLGGKTILFVMDALWSTSYEHQPPQKFQSAPFNNDWCSSMMFSLDPVAIESVCLDILQMEFTEEDLTVDPPRYTYVQWAGIDDYLHQAADSSWWPEGIEYDPEDDGTVIGSLGVHEHWDNVDNRKYSRNLGTGDGIELIEFEGASAIDATPVTVAESFNLKQNYPNPFNPSTTIEFQIEKASRVTLNIFNTTGQEVAELVSGNLHTGQYRYRWDAGSFPSGVYYCQLNVDGQVQTRKMMLLK